ncbi:lysophospholipid acyltransferase family protein [Isoalcanivorax indicus]|uniref:lysophospholipid acyltransferase family protein n=1 Tax=Isoalcanivorax indicus TaxID=2202653 RepID=UPI000DBA3D6C|nr:lysophospholipid acyltransferase family protein [Isoalcanivorax indicus]
MPEASQRASLEERATLFALRLFSRLPLGLVTRLGAGIAWLITWFPLRYASAYRVTLVNIMLCYPELSYREAAKRARAALTETGRTLAEFSHAWGRPAAESLARITSVKGLDRLRTAYASERPVLLLTLHQSSWELPNLLLGPEGPMQVFYQPGDSTALNEIVTRARESTGSTLVPADARGIKAAVAAMGRGEAVAILSDHTPKGRNNPIIPLFGYSVRTSNLPHKLIKRYQPHIFFVGCHRRNGPRDIEVYIEPAPEAAYSADETTCLTAINDTLATLISRYPTQYHWVYKRLRYMDTGKQTIYQTGVVPYLKQARREGRGLRLSDLR